MKHYCHDKRKSHFLFHSPVLLLQPSRDNELRLRRYAFVLLAFLAALPMQAQMLFSENLMREIDSTKVIQGSLQPELDFKTEKQHVFTIKNTANLNLLIKPNRVINLINKFELTTVGKKVAVNEGYIHGEYRYLFHQVFEIYPYAESQWAGSRGMPFKLSAGMQARYRVVKTNHCTVFANTALYYEYEKWEVDDPPLDANPYEYSRCIKHHLSATFKFYIGSHLELITTAIHQTKPKDYFQKARFAGAVDLIYRVTPTIGIRGAYRFIYDTHPIVPIGKDYTAVNAGLDIAF